MLVAIAFLEGMDDLTAYVIANALCVALVLP
jgi:hypothetical protein